MSLVGVNLGRRGESLAEQYLVAAGARVLARNYRLRSGELDLVVDHDGDLVGVEVKTRRPGQSALPEEAVGYTKLQRLERTLTRFAMDHGLEHLGWRIDVIALEIDHHGTVQRLDHIRDAYLS